MTNRMLEGSSWNIIPQWPAGKFSRTSPRVDFNINFIGNSSSSLLTNKEARPLFYWFLTILINLPPRGGWENRSAPVSWPRDFCKHTLNILLRSNDIHAWHCTPKNISEMRFPWPKTVFIKRTLGILCNISEAKLSRRSCHGFLGTSMSKC